MYDGLSLDRLFFDSLPNRRRNCSCYINRNENINNITDAVVKEYIYVMYAVIFTIINIIATRIVYLSRSCRHVQYQAQSTACNVKDLFE
jgi:hypothetical protein